MPMVPVASVKFYKIIKDVRDDSFKRLMEGDGKVMPRRQKALQLRVKES